jgi:antitoxin ParD1/3/4
MSRTYTPGPEADGIVERQLAKGTYRDADEVVRAGLQLLEEHEAELEELRRLIDEGDADIAAGRIHRYASADELTADIIARGGKLMPAKTLNVSRRARSDLDAIYARLRRVSDPATAKHFIAKLNNHLERIARLATAVSRQQHPPWPSTRRARQLQHLFPRNPDRDHHCTRRTQRARCAASELPRGPGSSHVAGLGLNPLATRGPWRRAPPPRGPSARACRSSR